MQQLRTVTAVTVGVGLLIVGMVLPMRVSPAADRHLPLSPSPQLSNVWVRVISDEQGGIDPGTYVTEGGGWLLDECSVKVTKDLPSGGLAVLHDVMLTDPDQVTVNSGEILEVWGPCTWHPR